MPELGLCTCRATKGVQAERQLVQGLKIRALDEVGQCQALDESFGESWGCLHL